MSEWALERGSASASATARSAVAYQRGGLVAAGPPPRRGRCDARDSAAAGATPRARFLPAPAVAAGAAAGAAAAGAATAASVAPRLQYTGSPSSASALRLQYVSPAGAGTVGAGGASGAFDRASGAFIASASAATAARGAVAVAVAVAAAVAAGGAADAAADAAAGAATAGAAAAGAEDGPAPLDKLAFLAAAAAVAAPVVAAVAAVAAAAAAAHLWEHQQC